MLRGGRRRVGAAGPLGARPKLLIFDFDGTIADTFSNGLEILNLLSGEFGFRALAAADVPKARDMRTRELMRFLGIRTTSMSRIARRGTEELRKRIDSIQPLPGAREILGAAQGAGFQLGIVTSNSEENVRRFLANHGLEVFAFVRSSSKLMGKGREVRILMKEMGLSPRDILLIGDETRDIEAAQEVGAHIAAVTWGYNSRTALESLHPDHIVETPGELLELLAAFPKP